MTLPYNGQVYSSGPTQEPSTCAKYDSNAIADKCVAYFDRQGGALPLSEAPKSPLTATASDGTSVSFNLAPTSGNDALSIDNNGAKTVSVTPGKYTELDLLGAAGSGPVALTITLTYSDGSQGTQTLSLPDWYKVTTKAVSFTGRYEPPVTATAMQTGSIGLGAFSVPVTGTKDLVSFTIANTPTTTQNALGVANILAATVEGTAAPAGTVSVTPPASSSSSAGATGTTSSSTSSSAASSSASSSKSSIPTTGLPGDVLALGAVLAAAGAAGIFSRKLRGHRV